MKEFLKNQGFRCRNHEKKLSIVKVHGYVN